jgi:hypothetical protein
MSVLNWFLAAGVLVFLIAIHARHVKLILVQGRTIHATAIVGLSGPGKTTFIS